jgi:hypothetical protein
LTVESFVGGRHLFVAPALPMAGAIGSPADLAPALQRTLPAKRAP